MLSLSASAADAGAVQRAKALAELMVLDTPDEQSFDDLVFVAAKACGVPIALITLLDTDRQWFKAKYGLDVCETDIEHSVCRIDIDKGDLLEIVDLTADARTKRNPLGIPEVGVFYPPNLTPDRDTGLGAWNEADIMRAVRTGVRPDGRVLAPVMPWHAYGALNDADARALARYLRSLPPVRNETPRMVGAGETPSAPYLTVVVPGR